MERTLSDYEKIKKAEEIYNRRKMMGVGGVRVSSPSISDKKPKKELNSIKKMVLQILICVVLYIIVYLVQNSNYIFSEQFMSKTREILTYDMNLKGHVTTIINTLKDNTNWFSFIPTDEDKSKEEENKAENQTNINNEVPGVGGSDVTNNIDSNTVLPEQQTENIPEKEQEEPPKTQMEIDADSIKANFSLSLPLKGTITSRFGVREIEPKNHVGIDIGANTGTDIVAAMDGEVKIATNLKEYGNHIKIESGKLATLYAHCNTLNVKVGDVVKKGQKIGTVGSTGNTTGPHLHFEVIFERQIC